MKDGKIVRVDYDEVKQDGASKRKSADYNTRMTAIRARMSDPFATESDSTTVP